MKEVSAEVRERAGRIRVVLLDVDGVLTDGRILMGSSGDDGRCFHSRDGLGMRLGQQAGLTFGIISGRRSEVVAGRASELDITEIHQGVLDKIACLEKILARLDVADDAICYIGDDLVDVPVMRRVGFAAAPSDAAPEAREAADYVTASAGGRGAVREVVDVLLRSSGKWKEVTKRFLE
jgi:3-deoxy-D-manno-octulosonate 8-phosphate phosphatase (KDO 8-P phosphatase)